MRNIHSISPLFRHPQQKLNVAKAIEHVLNEMDMVQKEFAAVNMATKITEEVKGKDASVADQFLK